MIHCTELSMDISSIMFPSHNIELLGKILGAADLLAQMADRTYLEKLLFLYYEFREGDVSSYEDEVDLLRKTVKFYNFIAQRLETMFDRTDRFMTSHFASRLDIHKNLYHEAIERQKNFLQQILEMPDSNPCDHLKRNGIIDKVRKKYGE
jgi:hypothetical protein